LWRHPATISVWFDGCFSLGLPAQLFTPNDPFIDENGVVFNVIHEIVELHNLVV